MSGILKISFSRLSLHFVFLVFLCSCASPRAARHYLLRNPVPANRNDSIKIGGVLFIEEFTAASEYSRRPFAYRSSEYQIDYDPLRKWAISPEDMIREKVLHYSQKTGYFDRVTIKNVERFPNLIFRGRIIKIGERLEKRKRFAELSLSLELVNTEDMQVLWSTRKSMEKKVMSNRFDTVMEALSECLEKILQESFSEIVDRVVVVQ